MDYTYDWWVAHELRRRSKRHRNERLKEIAWKAYANWRELIDQKGREQKKRSETMRARFIAARENKCEECPAKGDDVRLHVVQVDGVRRLLCPGCHFMMAEDEETSQEAREGLKWYYYAHAVIKGDSWMPSLQKATGGA